MALYTPLDMIFTLACGKTNTGASAGIDFGLKTYMTFSDGTHIKAPLFYRQLLNKVRRWQRLLSKAQKGSAHYCAYRRHLKRVYRELADKRTDWNYKTAHELCRRYSTICIEDLILLGMTRLWGRKVNDLAFGSFVRKLEHVASKYGTEVVKIDRFYPSSKTCSVCQYVNERLSLCDRSWTCPYCGTSHDRDLNASVNILRQGIASSGSIRKTQLAAQGALTTGESPVL